MTFMHKLSRRLALLKDALPLAAVLLASCDLKRNVAGVDAELSLVQMSPTNANLQPNQMADFTVVGLDQNGDTVNFAVLWTVTSGTIVDTGTTGRRHYGRYRAGSDTGRVKVIAKGRSSAMADTATVVVALASVASVSISPPAATIPAGTSVQLVAAVRDSVGNDLSGRSVSWRSGAAGVAIVNGSGVVTGIAAGSATITATSEGQSATAAITVTANPVASVTVSPAQASVDTGKTVQLTAAPQDANGIPLTGRVVTWASGNPAAATVNGSGLVRGVGAGSATITATSEGQSGTSAITVVAPTPVAVASVSVSPASASVPVGMVVQLTATPKDANGNALTGRLVSWTTANAAVATVTSTGLVAGVIAGSTTITATSEGYSGSSAITVIAPPPPGSSCLTQTGPSIVVSGALSTWGNTSMADNTRVNATAALFAGGANTPVRIGGGSGICYSGGVLIGRLPPSTAWSAMHDTYAMVVNKANTLTIENVRIFDYGDGPTFDATGDANWTFRGSYLKYMRDDCIENDFLNNGLIEDSFLDGCYDGVSSREYSGAQDGSNNVVVMRNSLVRLQAMDRAYGGTVPNHNAFWKWSGSIGPKVALYNNVFRADQRSQEGNGAGMYLAPPPGKLADCENNVMVWLGSGSFPETLPTTFNGKPCFRLLTGAEGLQFWNEAAARWKANHPWTLVDAGAPIASLFSPGIVGSTTLTGTVNLTATAVDDQDVAGVQFQIDGQNIGAEVTVEAPLTKFTRSWDSRSLPNGTYTLTATARDTAGKTTTSAGVTVTISN